jgi:hypothetical protein
LLCHCHSMGICSIWPTLPHSTTMPFFNRSTHKIIVELQSLPIISQTYSSLSVGFYSLRRHLLWLKYSRGQVEHWWKCSIRNYSNGFLSIGLLLSYIGRSHPFCMPGLCGTNTSLRWEYAIRDGGRHSYLSIIGSRMVVITSHGIYRHRSSWVYWVWVWCGLIWKTSV